MKTLIEEICREAFYRGREVKKITDRGVIFNEPTFEGWLRNPKTKKEIARLEKLYKESL